MKHDMEKIRIFLFRILFWIWPQKSTPTDELSELAPKRRRREKHQSTPGEFYFKENILDRLDDYFVVIKRMRKDRDAQKLYSKYGGIVLPEHHWKSTFADAAELSPWFLQTRPAFGAVFFPRTNWGKEEKRLLFPKFLYFRKYAKNKGPPEIQKANGDLYVGTVYWDAPEAKKLKCGVPQDFAVCVAEDGTITALRILQTVHQVIKSKKGEEYSIPMRRWQMYDYRGWLDWKDRTASESLCQWFCVAANSWEGAAMSMTKVRVKRGNVNAVFSVNMLRTPYFFKDRDVTINKAGSRKRIFHIVRTHKRNLADGRETYVKSHFRGEREFRWNNYSVRITVPGWHHHNMADFNFGGHDRHSVSEGYMEPCDLAGMLADAETNASGASERYRKGKAP